MRIEFDAHFLRSFKKLPLGVKDEYQVRLALFQTDPFDPKLRTHKLSGSLSGLWSFSVTSSHRILFRIKGGVAQFLDIGDHRIYR